FLQAVVKKQQKNKKLEDLILLILRCLIMALLALAFARPVLRSTAAGSSAAEEGARQIILLDVSGSMAQTAGITTLFEQAVAEARQHLDKAPSSVAIGLFFFADSVFPAVAKP